MPSRRRSSGRLRCCAGSPAGGDAGILRQNTGGRMAVGAGPIRLITISREYGAGGSELGALLGESLGWPVLDHELVRQLAARLSCEEGEVVAMDEHAPSFLERLAAVAVVTAPESRAHSPPWTTHSDCI